MLGTEDNMNKVFFPPHGPVRRQVAKDERVGEILTQCGRVTEGYGGYAKESNRGILSCMHTANIY